MTADDITALRREPPPFRLATVGHATHLTPHMRRLTLVGPELAGLEIPHPAASVRVLLPSPGTDDLVVPTWHGNEFLLPDGRRPLIRTFTPRSLRADRGELDVDVVLHGEIGASGWARSASTGDPVAISGPGRGYEIDPTADPLLLLGDETAVPAIGQLLESAPRSLPIRVHIEVARPDARLSMPEHPNAVIAWHDLPQDEPYGSTLLAAIMAEPPTAATRVWAAGEAAGVQRIRRHLFGEGSFDRSHASVRGYWKVGRAGPGLD